MPTAVYERRRPERTMLYQVVADNLETLYGAIDDGALSFKLGKHARKELEACMSFVERKLTLWHGRPM